MLKKKIIILGILLTLVLVFSCKHTVERITEDYYTPIITPTSDNSDNVYYFGDKKIQNGIIKEDVMYVQISCKDKKAIIFYTTDGSTPQPEYSEQYEAPIIIQTNYAIVCAATYHYSKKTGYQLLEQSTYEFKKLEEPALSQTGSTAQFNGVYRYSTDSRPTIKLYPYPVDADVFYTLDGSDPTPLSTKYNGPFILQGEGALTLKAVSAFKRNENEYIYSSQSSFNFDEKYELSPPIISPNRYDNSAYYFGADEEVEISIMVYEEDAVIYYTTDGTTKPSSFIPYTGPFKIAKNKDTKIIAKAEVTYDNSKVEKSPYSEQNFKILSAPQIQNFYDPTEDYANKCNNFNNGQTYIISLSDSYGGADIYYTLDGTEPTTNSELYTDPLEISFSDYGKLKAIAAIKRGKNISYSASTYAEFEELVSLTPPTIAPCEIDDLIYYHSYGENINLSLEHIQPFVKLYYTTDGTEPTQQSNEYNGGIANVELGYDTKLIKVKGFREYKNGQIGETSVGVAKFAWMEKPTSNIQGSKEQPYRYDYNGSATVEAQKNLQIGDLYYTTDGSTPNLDSPKYIEPITVSGYGFTTVKIANIIQRTDHYDISEIQTIVLEEKINVQPPTITPLPTSGSNKYYYPIGGVANAIITSEYDNYRIYYTLDGSEPTALSTLYNNNTGIDISGTGVTELKAITAFVHDNGDEEYSHWASALFQEKLNAQDLSLNITFANDSSTYPQLSLTTNGYKEYCQNASISLSPNGNFEIINPTYGCLYNSEVESSAQQSNSISIDSSKIIETSDKNYLIIKGSLTADNIEGYVYSSNLEIRRLTTSLTSPTFSNTSDEPFDVNMSLSISNPNQNSNSTVYYTTGNTYSQYSSTINLNSTVTVKAFAKNNKYFSNITSKKFTKYSIGNGTKLSNGTVAYQGLNYGPWDSSRNRFTTCSTDGDWEFNLYLPNYAENITTNKPCVVYVHGGSWTSGDQYEYARYFEQGWEKYAESYCQAWGLPVISIDYRHIGNGDNKLYAYAKASAIGITVKKVAEDVGYWCFGDNGVRIWDAAKDIESVMKFVKKYKNTLKIDTAFCIFDGYSAGANLEMLYALNNEYEKPIPIKALISRCGPADMSNYEYIKFFGDQLTDGTYKSSVEVYYGSYIPLVGNQNWSKSVEITIQMKETDPDTGEGAERNGKNFVAGMIKSATGLNCTYDQLRTLAQNGLDNAPTEVKKISPAAWVQSCNSLPYMVLAYGDVVQLHVGAKNYAGDECGNDFGSEVSLDGDPLAPRLAGEVLVKKLNARATQGLISTDADGRITKNKGSWCFYKGDINKGQSFAFIGASKGGHDIASKNDDDTFSKFWTAEEHNALQESINYALGTVCGLSRR